MMAGFVIEYNRKTGEQHVTIFDGENGPRDALRRRLELEATRTDSNLEIVSLNSDSLQTIRKTHARYFTNKFAAV